MLIGGHVRLCQAGWVGEDCQEMDVIKEDSRGRTTFTHDTMLLLLRRHGMIREIVYEYTEEGDSLMVGLVPVQCIIWTITGK